MKKCLICGVEFKPKRKKSVICSRKCSNVASRERAIKRNYRHGMRNTRFYTIWHGIMLRCLTKSCSSYEKYGAVGITICKRWQLFKNFYKDMYSEYEKHVALNGERNTTIDRIKNNLGYSPKNCRWATWKEQKANSDQFRNRNIKGQFTKTI